MPKRTKERTIKTVQATAMDRETKILNILCNTSILLMSALTEAFSDFFTGLSKEMVHALTTSMGVSEEKTMDMNTEMNTLKRELPKQMMEQMVTLKADMAKQLQVKKQEIGKIIADPAFDKGITIAEKYDFGLPPLTQELDEISLLRYIALMKAEHPVFLKMFQELVEWMKSVPQPP
jgi:hypothetical protein